jgi:hypothetical protein
VGSKLVVAKRQAKKVVRRPSLAARPEAAAGVSPAVNLTTDDRETLMLIIAQPTGSSEAKLRARALVMAADGASSHIIARTLGIEESVVNEWRSTFMAQPPRCAYEGNRMACRHTLTWVNPEAAEQPLVLSALSPQELR